MRRLMALAIGAVLVAAGCATGGSAGAPGTRTGVGERSITISLSGGVSYSNTATIDSGRLAVRYTSQSTVDLLSGTVTFPSTVAGSATATFDLAAIGGAFSGTVAVSDPAAGVAAAVAHQSAPLAIDGDGDASGFATDGPVTIQWSFTTSDVPGIEPQLDALSAAESDFCLDAQYGLTGLSSAELPPASVTNVDHVSRPNFAASKANLSPLIIHTWRESGQFDTAAGNNVVITERISCKTRSSDHLATLGLTVTPDQECKVLNQSAASEAFSSLTPGQQTTYSTSGTPIVFDPDVVRQTGSEWTAPLDDLTEVGGVARLRAHALQVNWTDPNYVLFSDSIRGVHYCTVRSPAWFYWWYTVGAF